MLLRVTWGGAVHNHPVHFWMYKYFCGSKYEGQWQNDKGMVKALTFLLAETGYGTTVAWWFRRSSRKSVAGHLDKDEAMVEMMVDTIKNNGAMLKCEKKITILRTPCGFVGKGVVKK